ncbi:ribulose-phosphate 3-epimerase, partial [Acinetobacter baumannii]
LNALEEILPYADYIVLMSVNPGFSGQRFIPTTMDKLRRLRRMIVERGLTTRIEVDGGIELDNVAEVAAAGAQIVVAATAVFGADDPEQA